MSVKIYPITLGYKATYMPYYGPGGSLYPGHHGIDYGTPTGVSVTIKGKTIAKTGATGLVSGPHVHIDKSTTGSRNYADYRNPSDWDQIEGIVTFAGNAGTAGNMIIIKSKSGYFYRFLHLSKILVKVGDKIGANMTQEEVGLAYKLDGRKATANDKKFHSSKGTPKSLLLGLIRDSAKAGNAKKISDLKKSLAKVQTALKNEKAKPPEVVVKEVEKIVEKIVEKEVGEEEAVRGFFGKLIDKIIAFVRR